VGALGAPRATARASTPRRAGEPLRARRRLPIPARASARGSGGTSTAARADAPRALVRAEQLGRGALAQPRVGRGQLPRGSTVSRLFPSGLVCALLIMIAACWGTK